MALLSGLSFSDIIDLKNIIENYISLVIDCYCGIFLVGKDELCEDTAKLPA